MLYNYIIIVQKINLFDSTKLDMTRFLRTNIKLFNNEMKNKHQTYTSKIYIFNCLLQHFKAILYAL